MNGDVELVVNGVSFALEEFCIGEQDFNFTFIGCNGNKCYNHSDFNLVYVQGHELEAVKNFLTTIRS